MLFPSFGFILSLGFILVIPNVYGETCQIGWDLYNHKCYFFSNDSVSWAEALARCCSKDAQLVAIETLAEEAYLEIYVRTSGKVCWSSGTKLTSDGKWTWLTTGKHINTEHTNLKGFQDWAPNEPNAHTPLEQCLELNPNLHWNDDECSKRKFYICEKLPQSWVTISTS